ncbi:hypothetical protein DMUE_5442 [Dictyocoela muelleri]|nr:hypothetical protein DMUE_5442 [Dictyocoela muelleri]
MVFFYCLNVNGLSKGRKPNQRGKSSSKSASDQEQTQHQESLRNQSGSAAFSQIDNPRTRLFQVMDVNEVDIQLFMMSRSRGFYDLDLDGKILHIVEQSDKNIQRWYFQKGSMNKLPDSYEKFVDELKLFIQERGISHIKRYSEESWVNYLI